MDVQYTLDTIDGYSKSMKNKVIGNMINNGYVSKKVEEGKIYIKEIEENNRVHYCINQNNDLIKEIEKWEFEKYYKYSMLYKIPHEVDIVAILNHQIEQGKILDYNAIEDKEVFSSIAEFPSYINRGNNHYLKFNLKFEALDSNRIEHKKRYPIVVCIDANSHILEVCYDIIEGLFGIEKELYVDMVKNWISNNIIRTLESFDLTSIVEYIIKHGESDGVHTVLQNMNLINGGVATLGVGKKRNNILPFVGEIKAIISNYRNELKDNNPDFLNEIDQYFYEIDEMTKYPWVLIKFSTIKVDVKFTKAPDNGGGYILQHYTNQAINNQDRGRMDYVKNYINHIGTIIEGDTEE